MTKISYICPIYNKKKYLPSVLKAIFSQIGEFKKEFIFIDDGSFDGSLDYLKKYTKQKKNIIIFTQSNKGPASATQKGLDNSSGDYIKLVGGDDVMAPNCSKILLETLKKTRSVAVFSKYKEFEKLSEIKFVNKNPKIVRTLKSPLFETLKSNYSGTTPNLYCNKAVRKSGGCYRKLFVEDFSLVLRIAKMGTFTFIDNVTSYGPKIDENRIMIGKRNQLLHDYNATIYYYLKENKELPFIIKKMACIKCLGRSEKWVRREIKKSIFTKINYLRFKYYLEKKNELDYIKKSCEIFYKYTGKNISNIRYKIS